MSLWRALLLPHPPGQGCDPAHGPGFPEPPRVTQFQLLSSLSGCVKNLCPFFASISNQKIPAPSKDSAVRHGWGNAATNCTVLYKLHCTNYRLSTEFRLLKNWILKKWSLSILLNVNYMKSSLTISMFIPILHLHSKEYLYTNANKIQNQTQDYEYAVILLKLTVKIQTSSTRWLFIDTGQ